jgi:hypothetical protein
MADRNPARTEHQRCLVPSSTKYPERARCLNKMSHSEIKGFSCFLALLATLYVIWRLTKRRVPPIPEADKTLDLGSGHDRVVYGYHKTSNMISIWSPKNPVVRVCRSRVSFNLMQATRQRTIGGYNKQYLVTAVTQNGEMLHGTAAGEYVPPMEVTENKTGYQFVWATVVLSKNRDPVFAGDTRELFDVARIHALVPPVRAGSKITYWDKRSEIAQMAAEVAIRFDEETARDCREWFASRGVQPR